MILPMRASRHPRFKPSEPQAGPKAAGPNAADPNAAGPSSAGPKAAVTRSIGVPRLTGTRPRPPGARPKYALH